jgi:anti-sigma regulatory factor (Ser/Thr protein kinase)
MSATPPFAALATGPGLARGHVRATLAEWGLGDLAEAAELIASEMTANAVNASAPVQAAGNVLVIRLCLLTDGAVLTIECWDQAPGIPVLRAAPGLAEAGRGMVIIDSLTHGAWGCQPAIGQAGKCVWAEIPVRDAPASPLLASAVPNRAATPGTN